MTGQSVPAFVRGEVLVVEDTPASLKLLSSLLTDAGYGVREAPNGELALWTALATPPDLILLDIRMPGINGIEVCKRLKADPRTSEVPVIFLSALSDADDKIEGFAAGAVDYVGKPYAPGEVLARVKTHVTLMQLSRALEREKQQLEVKVRERTADIEALLDAAQEVVIIATDIAGAIKVFNRGAENILGYREEDMRGRSPISLFRESEIRLFWQQMTPVLGPTAQSRDLFGALAELAGAGRRNWTFLRQDGKSLRVSLIVNVVRDDHAQPIGYLAIARDITDQLAAEADNLKLTLGLETKVRERTQALEESTAQLTVALEELNEAKDRLVNSEKLAALGAIVAAIAHKLNTPIGNCLTVASTLQANIEEFEADVASGQLRKSTLTEHLKVAREATVILQRGLTQSAELVDRFKQVAAERGGHERLRFKLADVVDGAAMLARQRLRGQPFTISVDVPSAIELDSYPNVVEQVLELLIDNSLMHGFLNRAQGTISIHARLEFDFVKISYRDDGVGMTDIVRRHVFEPFFTTDLSKGGAGLGMYIAYNLVARILGGVIDTVGEGVGGSEFSVMFPVSAPDAETT